MSNIINNTLNGFIYDVKIFGYTQRNCGGIFKSVGKLLVDANNNPVLNEFGEEQYKVTICSYNETKTDIHKIDLYLPCQLESFGDVKDTLYWDDNRGEYCILKKIGHEEGVGTIVYMDDKIIRTRITDKSFLLLRTFANGTILDFDGEVKGSIECVFPTTIEESNTSMVEQIESIRKDIEGFNNKIPDINLHLYKLKVSTFIFDELIEFDKWANENEELRIKKMSEIENIAKLKIDELNNSKVSFEHILNDKIDEININLSQNNTAISEKITDIQEQFDIKMEELEAVESSIADSEDVRNSNETIRENQENQRQSSMNNMINTVNGKIADINNKISSVDNKLLQVDDRVNSAIASGTVDLEVKDSRISQDGTVYTCLNDRLNAMENSPYILFEIIEG